MPSEAPSLLPPQASPLERALEQVTARGGTITTPIARMLDPATIDAALLPWLGWALSIDRWDTHWSVDRKRSEVAGAIADQRRKGTRASMRAVLDRFDPLIKLVEWWEANPQLEPYRARLVLPLKPSQGVVYDAAFLSALLRDIATVKPVRAHLDAVQTLLTAAAAYLAAGARVAGTVRLEVAADEEDAREGLWGGTVQTQNGEPLRDESTNDYLEAA